MIYKLLIFSILATLISSCFDPKERQIRTWNLRMQQCFLLDSMARLHLLDSACACVLSKDKEDKYDKKRCDSLLQRLDINDGLDTSAILPKPKPSF